jgi:FKBP-type peptidyl-prolyl cis-trans isomerase FkpA
VATVVAVSPARSAEPTTQSDRTLYTLGYSATRDFAGYRLTPAQRDALWRGVVAGIHGKVPEAAIDMKALAEQYLAVRVAMRNLRMKTNQATLARYAKQLGVKPWKSGVLYKQLEAGAGATPDADDEVVLQFKGERASDGVEFESTFRRGKPATLNMQHIVPCWQEAFQKMKAGTRAKIVCPSDLAYGENGFKPQVGENEVLVFEVTLVDVIPASGRPPPLSVFPLPWVAPSWDAGVPTTP